MKAIHCSSRPRGFTLIELLVVMIIISVMVGMATVSLKRDYTDLLADDANRLRALIMLGRDEALFQARSLGLRFTRSSYDFVIGGETRGSWVPLQDKQFRLRKLNRGVEITVLRNDTTIELNPEGSGKSSDKSKSESGGKGGKDKKVEKKPQIYLLSTGEVTPFTIELIYPARARLEMSVDALGEAKIISNELY